jgi:hypothetical protein
MRGVSIQKKKDFFILAANCVILKMLKPCYKQFSINDILTMLPGGTPISNALFYFFALKIIIGGMSTPETLTAQIIVVLTPRSPLATTLT